MSRATKSVMVRGHAARRNVLAPGVQLSGCAGAFLRSIFTHLYCRVRRIPHLTRSIEFIRTHPSLPFPLYSFNDQLTHHSCFYPAASTSGWIHRNIKILPSSSMLGTSRTNNVEVFAELACRIDPSAKASHRTQARAVQ